MGTSSNILSYIQLIQAYIQLFSNSILETPHISVQTSSHEAWGRSFASSIVRLRIVDHGLIMAGPPCSLMTGASSSVHMRRTWRLWGDVSRYKVRLSNRVWLNFVPSIRFRLLKCSRMCFWMIDFVNMFSVFSNLHCDGPREDYFWNPLVLFYTILCFSMLLETTIRWQMDANGVYRMRIHLSRPLDATIKSETIGWNHIAPL